MNEITVANVTTPIVEYKGCPVCTTKQLAEFYGCEERQIRQNGANNSERFEEGKHFVKLEGETLRKFKQGVDNFYSVPAQVKSLILWTEKGAARHAKMLSTDRAWDVFEQLEDVYFRARNDPQQQSLKASDRPLSRNQVAAGILLLRAAAEDLNLAPSAVLGGYQRLEARLGVSGLLPIYAVDAPAGSSAGSSEIAKPIGQLLEEFSIGMSAVAFNRLLLQRGFLAEHERPSSKGSVKKFKVVTNLEYGKNSTHPNNQKESQPLWYQSKFNELLELVMPPKLEAV